MHEVMIDGAAIARLAKALVFICGSSSSNGCPTGSRRERLRAGHQKCSRAISEIEARGAQGRTDHARRLTIWLT